jgi:cytoskeletal protein RodZ
MNEAEAGGLDTAPIGERLRVAREERGMSLEELAAQTRIPIRHLQHIEVGEWSALPATTYSVGFVRSYANAIGLDGTALASELRRQLGTGGSPAAPYYEPADPARVPPRWLALVAGAIALLLIGGYLWWRSGVADGTRLDRDAAAGITSQPAAPPAPKARPGAAPQPASAPAPAAQGPVTLTATADVWLRVYDGTKANKLIEKTMKAGESFQVPPTAQQPKILTGRPDSLQVSVGTTRIPPLGAPQQTISDVSLLPNDLIARVRAAPQPPR